MTPVLTQDEYVEQAYFFRIFRTRLAEGLSAQDVLVNLQRELLGTTKLPLAVEYMLAELRHNGMLGPAVGRLAHYFTPFQAHCFLCAEDEASRFTLTQSLLILEREAEYRAKGVQPAGLFIYELETISRNRLGYFAGLSAMADDATFDEAWSAFIKKVRQQIDVRDFAEMIYLRSAQLVIDQRRYDPDFEPREPILFGEKEGKIASANMGKDPMYLFATLQRQLGYPEVPRLPKPDPQDTRLAELETRLKQLETKVIFLEGELTGNIDLNQFMPAKKEGK